MFVLRPLLLFSRECRTKALSSECKVYEKLKNLWIWDASFLFMVNFKSCIWINFDLYSPRWTALVHGINFYSNYMWLYTHYLAFRLIFENIKTQSYTIETNYKLLYMLLFCLSHVTWLTVYFCYDSDFTQYCLDIFWFVCLNLWSLYFSMFFVLAF